MNYGGVLTQTLGTIDLKQSHDNIVVRCDFIEYFLNDVKMCDLSFTCFRSNDQVQEICFRGRIFDLGMSCSVIYQIKLLLLKMLNIQYCM